MTSSFHPASGIVCIHPLECSFNARYLMPSGYLHRPLSYITLSGASEATGSSVLPFRRSVCAAGLPRPADPRISPGACGSGRVFPGDRIRTLSCVQPALRQLMAMLSLPGRLAPSAGAVSQDIARAAPRRRLSEHQACAYALSCAVTVRGRIRLSRLLPPDINDHNTARPRCH